MGPRRSWVPHFSRFLCEVGICKRAIVMRITRLHPGLSAKRERGFTLLELIVAAAILSILTLLAFPLARVTVQREKERQLRRDLWEMRDAIDRYKDAADKGAMQVKADSLGYPPDLETLVNGVDIQDKKVKFLRR